MKISKDTVLISIDTLLEDCACRQAGKMRLINGENVLFDFELAELLHVTTNNLIRKVRANKDRFPADFLIKIPANKFLHLLPTPEKRRKILYAFTLAGIMMATGRFNTERANQISIKMVEFICGRLGGGDFEIDLISKRRK